MNIYIVDEENPDYSDIIKVFSQFDSAEKFIKDIIEVEGYFYKRRSYNNVTWYDCESVSYNIREMEVE